MFDPMHNGHLDLIERSLRIFDELIVAVVANPSKEPLFTAKERLELIDECTTGIGMSRMRITSFDGLLIDLVEREGADCRSEERRVGKECGLRSSSVQSQSKPQRVV